MLKNVTNKDVENKLNKYIEESINVIKNIGDKYDINPNFTEEFVKNLKEQCIKNKEK